MSHHTHDHHSHQEAGTTLSFREKGEKLLHHWLHHNEEHALSYQKWASEFRTHQFEEVAALLENVIDLTQQINHTLKTAKTLLSSKTD